MALLGSDEGQAIQGDARSVQKSVMHFDLVSLVKIMKPEYPVR